MLEEQRYFARLRNSEMKRNNLYQNHYQNIVVPQSNIKRHQELLEKEEISRRRKAYDEYE